MSEAYRNFCYIKILKRTVNAVWDAVLGPMDPGGPWSIICINIFGVGMVLHVKFKPKASFDVYLFINSLKHCMTYLNLIGVARRAGAGSNSQKPVGPLLGSKWNWTSNAWTFLGVALNWLDRHLTATLKYSFCQRTLYFLAIRASVLTKVVRHEARMSKIFLAWVELKPSKNSQPFFAKLLKA